MRILLIGEYSNVHWTLAEGLRSLGHEVCVASNGDFWKNYKRNISLTRSKSKISGIKLLLKNISNIALLLKKQQKMKFNILILTTKFIIK